MKTTKILAILVVALGLMVCLAQVSKAAPMGTAFTYQGRLLDAGSPADGEYGFWFKLYDSNDPCTGTQLGSAIGVNDLDVIDGHFVVELDFGSGTANHIPKFTDPNTLGDSAIYEDSGNVGGRDDTDRGCL